MGNMIAAYKVADMYKNGYFVEKDEEQYKRIIEDLYPKVKDARQADEPLPEIFTRLARIRAEAGDEAEALRLYGEAADFLAWRIQCHPFFGDLNIMKWTVEDIYKLRPMDEDDLWLYDLYYLLQSPCKVTFFIEGNPHEAEAAEEDGIMAVSLDDQWFRSVDDLFLKGELDGELLTMRFEELYDFEVQ